MPVRFLALLYLAAAAFGQVSIDARRLSDRPLLEPGNPAWTSTGLFNPAAVRIGNRTAILFRATDANGTSRIGYAESSDGWNFQVRPEPVLAPEAAYEKGGGVEDPRVVKIGATYFLTYTGYNRKDAQLCLATSRDLVNWARQGIIMPAYKGKWNTGWTKAGSIIPVKINGKWWMYYMGTRQDSDGKERDLMGVASSKDLVEWSDATSQPVLDRRPGAFDSRVMEPGPTPILTKAGILLLYNGADDKLVYGPGWILFDRNNPTRVIARCEKPFLLPELEWERVGVVPNVIFLEGAIARTGNKSSDSFNLIGYYGAADKYVGAMQITIKLTQP